MNRNSKSAQFILLANWNYMVQVSDFHEGFVEVVQLQNTGQQEKARDHNTGEEFRQSKCFQTNCSKPDIDKNSKKTVNILYFTLHFSLSLFQKSNYKSKLRWINCLNSSQKGGSTADKKPTIGLV